MQVGTRCETHVGPNQDYGDGDVFPTAVGRDQRSKMRESLRANLQLVEIRDERKKEAEREFSP